MLVFFDLGLKHSAPAIRILTVKNAANKLGAKSKTFLEKGIHDSWDDVRLATVIACVGYREKARAVLEAATDDESWEIQNYAKELLQRIR